MVVASTTPAQVALRELVAAARADIKVPMPRRDRLIRAAVVVALAQQRRLARVAPA